MSSDRFRHLNGSSLVFAFHSTPDASGRLFRDAHDRAFDPRRSRWFATCSASRWRGTYPHLLRRLLRHTDVGRPNMIGSRRQKLGLLIGGMAQLAAPFADLTVLGEDAIHGSDRAQIDALVEQAGVDFGGYEIDEARPPQHIEDVLLLGVGQRPQGLWTRPRWRGRLFPCELAAMQAGAREPSAVQAAAIRPLRGASAAAASIRSPRRSRSEDPAAEQFFFGFR